jgi:hypothetical protein
MRHAGELNSHRSDQVTYPQVWSNAAVRALPIGRLGERTLWNVLLGRRQFFRAGPWVPLEEDDSRLLRVSSVPEPLWADVEVDLPEPAAAELLFASHPLSQAPHAKVDRQPAVARAHAPSGGRARRC